MMRKFLAALLAGAALVALPGQLAVRADPVPNGIKWTEAYFNSEDGTRLHANVFQSANLKPGERTPVILSVGPYFGTGGLCCQDPVVGLVPDPAAQRPGPVILDGGLFKPGNVIQRGYTFIEVDLRGYGASGGCADFLGKGEASDVKSAVEWAAAQPWSTGKVGMWGTSYDGGTGIVALAEKPKGLAAAIIQAPISTFYRMMYMNGNRYSPISNNVDGYTLPLLFDDLSVSPPGIYSQPEQFTNHYSGLTPNCYSRIEVGALSPDPTSAFWRERDYRSRAAGSTVPVLWSQGFADGGVKPDNFLDVYTTMKGPHRAWIGQWVHASAQSAELGHPGVLGRSGFLAEAIRWFDVYLKGLPPSQVGLDADPPAEIQEGDGRWRAEQQWPPTDAVPYSIPLHPGNYTDRAGNSAEANSSSNIIGPINDPNGVGTWTFSPPLAVDAHLAGLPRLTANLNISLPGVNLVGLLYDVDGKGQATLMSRGVYVVQASGTTTFDLYPEDWRVKAGHRIGLLLSGADDSWFTPGTTGTTVSVTGGTLQLPMLSCRRTSFIPGGPSDVVNNRGPFGVDAGTISAAAVEAPLPSGVSGAACSGAGGASTPSATSRPAALPNTIGATSGARWSLTIVLIVILARVMALRARRRVQRTGYRTQDSTTGRHDA